MIYKPKKNQRGRLGKEQKKMLHILVFPFIVVILTVVILIADHGKEGQGESEAFTETESVPESPTETMGLWDSGERLPEEPGDEPDETEPPEAESEEEPQVQDPFATEDFQRDPVPEILELMNQYLQARAMADAEAMNQVYGIGEVPAKELEEQKKRMSNYSKYVQDFENVATYVMEGPEENTWLVYTAADINFYSAKTRAPLSLWCFVQKDGEGRYTIMDSRQYTQEQMWFAEVANHSQEVRRLAADINARLTEALASDERLKAVYGVLQAGSPVWEGTAETEPEVEILGEGGEDFGQE